MAVVARLLYHHQEHHLGDYKVPRVERFTAQGEIPVQQAQLIDPGGFPADTSSAEALRVAGETVADFALRLERERKVKEELAKRKRAAQDRIGITDANAIMDNVDREYGKRIIGVPLPEHAAIMVDEINKARAKVAQLDLSPDAREIANSNTDIKADKFSDIAELANIVATDKDALIRVSEAYMEALTEGDIDDIDNAERLLDAQLKNMTPAEATKYKAGLDEKAMEDMEDKALSNLRDKASLSPDNFLEIVTDELAERKKGKTSLKIGQSASDFALASDADLITLKNYAKGIITSNKNKIQEQYDIATGEAVKSWTGGIVSGTLTEQGVWETLIAVSPGQEADLAAFKSKWATVARGIATRKRAQQEGKNKKAREDAYNPKLAAELKTDARNAESEKQIMTINERAAKALVQDFIDDADMEAISLNASKSFDTVVDKTIDSHDAGLKAIMLKGTSTVSLPAWLQSQVLAITATGRLITSAETQELIRNFGEVGKAREWGADEARREIEAELEKTEKKETVNDVRILYLQAQKRWLSKTDIELVEEYKSWLNSKP